MAWEKIDNKVSMIKEEKENTWKILSKNNTVLETINVPVAKLMISASLFSQILNLMTEAWERLDNRVSPVIR